MPDERDDASRFPEPPDDQEIEARLRRLIEGNSGPDLPEEELDEIELKLRDIEERVAAAGSSRMPEVPEFNFKRPPSLEEQRRQDQKAYAGAGLGLSVAYTIIGVPLIGVGIGWLLQRQTGSPVWMAVFTLGGMVLGVVMALVMINRRADQL